jgi:hypothetical protein
MIFTLSVPFVSEGEFYQQLDKTIFKEYDHAAYSIRRKISYEAKYSYLKE